MAAEKNTPQRQFRLRIALLLFGILLFFVAFNVLSQAIHTLRELTRVESERDQWQRPDEVLRALELKPGSVVVDLGSGAGYFSLKISKSVGDRGKVLAVDLRKLSLTFLFIRSLLQSPRNVNVIVGEPNDPRLGLAVVDSVLIANTYHELDDPKPILAHILHSLRPGGRLVVVDRGPEATDRHEIACAQVMDELAAGGFQVTNVDTEFISRPGDHWWLIVAQKPL